jgi:hypothetical protein
VKSQARLRFRRGAREDADLLVRLIDMSSHGGIGEHYRQIYGGEIDWKNRARLEIASGGSELGYQNAILIASGAETAGGMILNPLRGTFIFASPPETRAGEGAWQPVHPRTRHLPLVQGPGARAAADRFRDRPCPHGGPRRSEPHRQCR